MRRKRVAFTQLGRINAMAEQLQTNYAFMDKIEAALAGNEELRLDFIINKTEEAALSGPVAKNVLTYALEQIKLSTKEHEATYDKLVQGLGVGAKPERGPAPKKEDVLPTAP